MYIARQEGDISSVIKCALEVQTMEIEFANGICICAQKYFPQFYPTPFQYIILKYHYKSPNWAPKRRCSDVTDKGEVDSILTTKYTA